MSSDPKPGRPNPSRATVALERPTNETKGPGRVLAFGELLWDQLPNGSVIGGAAANFASRVQSLGIDTALVSRVGQDDLGQESVQILQRLGLATTLIQRDARKATGTVAVTFDDYGSPSYDITQDVAYDYIACTPEVVTAAKRAELIYFGTLAQRGSKLFNDLACGTCHLDTGTGRGPSLKDIVGTTVELQDGTTA